MANGLLVNAHMEGAEMIVFELDTDRGDTRDIIWLGCTSLTGSDRIEADNIYEQLVAHEIFLDE